jgi:multidrug efflux pump
VLTLYTTPVIYIFFDNLSQRFTRKPESAPREGERVQPAGPPPPGHPTPA